MSEISEIMSDTYKISFRIADFLEDCHIKLKMLHNLESIWIVMGNESCDLDSAVCALVYAFFKSCNAELTAANSFKEENAAYVAKHSDLCSNTLAHAFHGSDKYEAKVKEELLSTELAMQTQTQKVHSVSSDHCLDECSKTAFATEKDGKSVNLQCEEMTKLKQEVVRKTDGAAFLPLLNVPKDKFMLKTEVTYFLAKYGIPLDKLIFRDTLNLEELEGTNKLNIILVDHHVLPPESEHLSSCVREIIDHRPLDPKAKWSEGVLHLTETGSCATLITEKIMSFKPCLLTREMAAMLYGPIVLDTACFSPQAKRATALDHRMAEVLETIEGQNLQRSAIFSELLRARTDISSLSSLQILDKDYKIISGIPIAGLPILVQDFVKRADWWDALKKWSEMQHSEVVILMGMKIENLITSRDLALVDNGNSDLVTQLMDALLKSKNPDLCLQRIPMEESYIELFLQKNAQASRKQVVPIITCMMLSLK